MVVSQWWSLSQYYLVSVENNETEDLTVSELKRFLKSHMRDKSSSEHLPVSINRALSPSEMDINIIQSLLTLQILSGPVSMSLRHRQYQNNCVLLLLVLL